MIEFNCTVKDIFRRPQMIDKAVRKLADNGYTEYASTYAQIRENMFNRKNPNTNVCSQSTRVWHGEYNYIPMVRWDYFVGHVTELIERAERIKDDYERNYSYELHLGVNQ